MMIKKDWSIVRITVLLYFIVVLLPVNYFLAAQSFQSVQNDAKTMNQLVIISYDLQRLASANDSDRKEALLKEIDRSLQSVKETFIQYPPNEEYVALFQANEVFIDLDNAYKKLVIAINGSDSIDVIVNHAFKQVSNFSKVGQEMASYKNEVILDKLFLSLAFTMLSIIALVFFIRLYMKLQLQKHAVHDHLTGLYNKKYFEHALNNAILLETRQENPLSLITLSIGNYDKLKTSLDKKSFEKSLVEFSELFNHFFRRSDTVCRMEPDYFASIIPDASTQNVQKLSARLQEELESKYSNSSIKIEIQVGSATYDKDSDASLLETATIDMQSANMCKIGGES